MNLEYPHARRTRRTYWCMVAFATTAAVVLGTLGAIPAAQAAVGTPVTYEGHSYDSSVKRPSENKPQSKLWFHDGAWWALLVSEGGTVVHIHELMDDHTWRNTGTLVDPRVDGTGDALWSARDEKLYVATRSDGSDLRVARFSYNEGARTWSTDAGFPVSVETGGGSESATLDQDSTGRLWVTYTRGSRLWVARSEPGGLNWTAGFQPNIADTTIKSDDISALIAFDGKIGVLWSDQQSHAFRFAIHEDGAPDNEWRVEDALAGTDLADDHINLKQLAGDSEGRIFAAIKTSQDTAGSDATLVGVLVRKPRADGTGDWSLVPAGTVQDDHTRPIIMIDQTNQELYFFATAPVSGGEIFYKKTPLANPSFPPGQGQPFVDYSKLVNNASGSKDPVTAQTGMVVLAVAEGVKRYVHAEMELAGGGSPPAEDTSAPSVPAGLEAQASAGGVDLTWSASNDDVGVSGYTVRRDGGDLETTAETAFTDTTVSAGQTYSYTVEAFDAAGNQSGESETVSVTVPDDLPPPQEPPDDGIAVRGVASAANNAESTLTIPAPSYQAGDLLLASVDYRGKSTITTPMGWELLRLDSNGTTMRKATFWRVAASNEPDSYTWQFGAKPAAVGSILAYSGVSGTSPIEASDGLVNASSTSLTAPSVTTSSPGAVVVGLFGVARDAALTPPADMTERTDISSPEGVSYPMTAGSADLTQASAGATGPKVAASTAKGPSIGHTVVLRPAD